MIEIREKIIQALGDEGREEVVKDVRIGLGYTAVQLESGRTGLAFTFRQDLARRLFRVSCPAPPGRPAGGPAFVLSQFR